jgi:uncharacterized protein (TIGR01777 family)
VKRSILTSRVGATTRVVDALRACTPEERPTVLVSSSAVGYYGTSSSLRFDESSASGSDYLSKVCREWEAAAAPAASLGARVVVLRMGIVLDKGGGALASMAPVFQLFAGGPLGDGRQFFSWVHRDDAVSIICRAMQDAAVSGPYNVTAPRPVRMGEFCQSLGAAMGRPAWCARNARMTIRAGAPRAFRGTCTSRSVCHRVQPAALHAPSAACAHTPRRSCVSLKQVTRAGVRGPSAAWGGCQGA